MKLDRKDPEELALKRANKLPNRDIQFLVRKIEIIIVIMLDEGL